MGSISSCGQPEELSRKQSQESFVQQNCLLRSSSQSIEKLNYPEYDSENILNVLSAGHYMPCFKNHQSDNLWQEQLDMLEKNNNKALNGSLPSTSNSTRVNSLYKNNDSVQNYREMGYYYVQQQEDVKILQLSKLISLNKLNELVVVGPPAKLRWGCWKHILLFNQPKLCYPNVYENHLDQINEWTKIIKRDCNRTLNRHPYFFDEEEDNKDPQESISQIGQMQLIRVLNAISNSLPQLGYCQGMNFLTGLMLVVSGSDESMCFSAFMSLLLSTKHMLYFLYCQDIPFHGLLSYFIKQNLKKHFPSLSQNIKKQNVPDSFWITKILMSLFLYIMDFNNCVRIWDYIIARGAIRAIPEITVALLGRLADKIVEADFEQFASLFQGFVVSQEKDQCSLDQNLKIGEVIIDAITKYRISRKSIKDYSIKYISKNKNSPHKEFYSLFKFYENESTYEMRVKEFMKLNVINDLDM